MTAKHDFIADNPHIAYSGKPDTSTPGVMLLKLAIDSTEGDTTIVSAPFEKPSEVFGAMKDGVIIESLINLTSSGEFAGMVQFIGVDYFVADNNLVIETPIAQILGLLESEEWTISEG